MPYFFFDSTMIIVLPAILLALWAQLKVRSAYAHYSEIQVRSGMTGAEVAEMVLKNANVAVASNPGSYPVGAACGINAIAGEMTDHYDPRTRMLNLSEGVYYGHSIAALGIAAHEAGHAVQHARMYAPLALRNIVYPITNIGSSLAFPLFFMGFLFRSGMMLQIAIFLYSFMVFFTVVTLPVEFNASRRALVALREGRYLDAEELVGARKVLTAAALTYVAAALTAVLELVRMVLLSRNRS